MPDVESAESEAKDIDNRIDRTPRRYRRVLSPSNIHHSVEKSQVEEGSAGKRRHRVGPSVSRQQPTTPNDERKCDKDQIRKQERPFDVSRLCGQIRMVRPEGDPVDAEDRGGNPLHPGQFSRFRRHHSYSLQFGQPSVDE